MESRVPLPTDNIYKFYALFGLLLFIFGMGASIVQTKFTNDFFVKSFVGLEALKAIQKPSPVENLKRDLTVHMIEIEKANQKYIGRGLGVVIAAGLVLMFFGFGKWHSRIQPAQDEMLQLQLEKLRREVAALPLLPQVNVAPPPFSETPRERIQRDMQHVVERTITNQALARTLQALSLRPPVISTGDSLVDRAWFPWVVIPIAMLVGGLAVFLIKLAY